MNASEVLDKIESTKRKREKDRAYLGASMIGTECDMYLQMGLRGYPQDPFPQNVLRIFKLGQTIEDMVVADLKAAGFHVLEVDDFTRRQFEWHSFGGHIKSHGDGLIDLHGNEVMSLLEIKSMNKKRFNAFLKHGVKKSDPKYFAQVQMMMGLSNIKDCLFVCYCKDNSEYGVEVVDYDDFEWGWIAEKIDRVLEGSTLRAADKPDRFICKWCNRKSFCWREEDDELEARISRECRTCKHAWPLDNGGWRCLKHEIDCTDPCDDWAVLEATPCD